MESVPVNDDLAGCRAYPTGATCPGAWCEEAQFDKMCRGCRHFTSGRAVSIYQQGRRTPEAKAARRL